jgi:LPPG:FO 2-phospho-L-lactate transferase
MCLVRTELLRAGRALTDAHAAVVDAMGVSPRVLPMCDEPVATWVRSKGRWVAFQEFMVLGAAAGPVEAVELRGVERARPTDAVLATLAEAEATVIGPSNPVISIGPILAVPGMRAAIASAGAPVLAVSPFVAGRAVKGPTEAFMAAIGRPVSAAGVASLYEGLVDGMVVDAGDPDAGPEGLPVLIRPILMEGPAGRRAVAEEVLAFARTLARGAP